MKIDSLLNWNLIRNKALHEIWSLRPKAGSSPASAVTWRHMAVVEEEEEEEEVMAVVQEGSDKNNLEKGKEIWIDVCRDGHSSY